MRDLENRMQRLDYLAKCLVHPGERIAHPDIPPVEARAQLRGYLDRVLASPDPVYRAAQETWLQEGCALFAAVHESTTAAQREQAARRLRA